MVAHCFIQRREKHETFQRNGWQAHHARSGRSRLFWACLSTLRQRTLLHKLAASARQTERHSVV